MPTRLLFALLLLLAPAGRAAAAQDFELLVADAALPAVRSALDRQGIAGAEPTVLPLERAIARFCAAERRTLPAALATTDRLAERQLSACADNGVRLAARGRRDLSLVVYWKRDGGAGESAGEALASRLTAAPGSEQAAKSATRGLTVQDQTQAQATVETADRAPAAAEREGPRIRASRMFLGRDFYPPSAFAAYGIVVFPAKATSSDFARHEMICEAFFQTLISFSDLGVPVAKQMVTVWPVERPELAADLNREDGPEVACPRAVRGYDLLTALRAQRDAEAAGAVLEGRGPFLLAWSPGSRKGARDALVMSHDLSDVTLSSEAKTIFAFWRREIEKDPELWENGFTLEALRFKVKLWLDRHGTDLLAFFGG